MIDLQAVKLVGGKCHDFDHRSEYYTYRYEGSPPDPRVARIVYAPCAIAQVCIRQSVAEMYDRNALDSPRTAAKA